FYRFRRCCNSGFIGQPFSWYTNTHNVPFSPVLMMFIIVLPIAIAPAGKFFISLACQQIKVPPITY
ncbi:hypothetical protein, partial [Serratia sp. (in: enterobacteria)]|uniref:hypothetical protein n=1 Tax=Serratia sp. (in: enterobacteria) TaxID=616 RepID=UPI00398A43C1